MSQRIHWKCPLCARTFAIPAGNNPSLCPDCKKNEAFAVMLPTDSSGSQTSARVPPATPPTTPPSIPPVHPSISPQIPTPRKPTAPPPVWFIFGAITGMVCALLLVAGCNNHNSALESARQSEIERRADQAGVQLAQFRKEMDAMKFVLSGVLEERDDWGAVDPTDTGYAHVDCGVGKLLVSCENAAPYLDGHRIKLKIGNPYRMNFKGFTLRARFGKQPPVLTDNNYEALGIAWKEWKKSLSTKDVKFLETLESGTWTEVEMILSPSKPEDIRHISLKVQTDVILLSDSIP